MRLTHLAIYTRELERLKRFYATYFDAAAGAPYHNPKTGLQTYFLTFSDGCRLELMTRPELLDPPEAGLRVGMTHLAFDVGGKAQVDALTARLCADGFDLLSAPRTTGDGYYESCVLDPDGNRVEITG